MINQPEGQPGNLPETGSWRVYQWSPFQLIGKRFQFGRKNLRWDLRGFGAADVTERPPFNKAQLTVAGSLEVINP